MSSGRRSWRFTDSPVALLTLAALLWSSNFVLGRGVRTEIPPVALAFWRWTLAAIMIAPLSWRHVVRDRHALQRSWPLMALLALLGVATFDTLNYLALQTIPATNALLLQSTIPVLIVGFSFALFRERIRLRQGVGLAISLLGAITIVTEGRLGSLLALGADAGSLFAFVAVLSYAAYSSLLGHRPDVHPLSFLLSIVTVGSLMLLPLYLWESAAIRPFHPTTTAILSLGYLALFPSVIAYLCYIRGVARIGANRAGAFIHLMPLFGSILAMLFLGETFETFHAAGLALILIGVALAGVAGRGSRASSEEGPP